MRDRQRGRINTERSVEAQLATLWRLSTEAFLKGGGRKKEKNN